MRRRLGCLVVLIAIAALSVEVWVFLLVVGWTKSLFGTVDILVPIILLALMSFAGVRLAIWHGKRLPLELMSGNIGPRMVGLIGAIALAFPGFASGVIGLLLQIPLFQRLFARPAAKIGGAMVRTAMQRAMGGGLPPGLFSGGAFPGGPFPGMMPADDSVKRMMKPPKTIDTTVEKDEPE